VSDDISLLYIVWEKLSLTVDWCIFPLTGSSLLLVSSLFSKPQAIKP